MKLDRKTIITIIKAAQAILTIIAGFIGGAVTADAATLFGLYA